MSPNKRVGGLPSLLAFMTAKLGYRKAVLVGAFIAQWGVLATELGREPTRHEYCDRWGFHQASYYRHLELLKVCWPEDRSPQRVWLWCERQLPAFQAGGSEDDVVAAVLVLPASA